MEFRQLQYMLMVADERSFSKAAQKLFIAQPSLSQYIGKLEQQLGVQLFDRSSTPLTLTYAGELFAENARRILDMRKQLEVLIGEVANCERGRITFGISVGRSKFILPKILPIFFEKFPGIEAIPIEGTSTELEELAMKGITDFSITLPMNSSYFFSEHLFTEEYVILAPANHPLRKNAQEGSPFPMLNISNLRNESFILLPPGRTLRLVADQLFAQAEIEPKIILETKNTETLFALIATGLGVSIFTDTLPKLRIPFEFSQQIAYFSLENAPKPRTVAITYRKDRYLSKAARDFITLIKEILVV